jgi:serine protease
LIVNKKISVLVLTLILGLAILMTGSSAATAQPESPLAFPVDQIIVKYKDEANLNQAAQAQASTQMQRLNDTAGVEIDYFRPMSGDAHVLRLAAPLSVDEARAMTARLAALPEVEYAEPDYIAYALDEPSEMPMVVPNDTRYDEQWHYFAPSAGNYGVNAPAAWDITTGAAGIYAAVLDTGITNHADLSGRWTGGYDMVSDIWMANDGNARDANPHDPGDWIAADDCYPGSPARNSSWHGTHVAGTIGAATNNGLGVAGLNWVSQVIPVRVLGRCGGYSSDIADGIRWAAGLSVTGVPDNPNPVQVMNMSLGGYNPDGCSTTYQSAINAAYGEGAMVVVSAGNSNDDASDYQPASCNNVVTVAATDRYGDRAYYSNYGSTVEISAPGGETAVSANGVLSTLNSGTTVPASDTYAFYQGTSMAAPHVTGVASLIFSLDSALSPAQVLSYMQSTVTAFPGGSTCNTSNCGSGIVNAAAALAAVGSTGPDAPVLDPIENSDTDGNYTVSWSEVALAAGAGLPDSAPLAVTADFTIFLPFVLNASGESPGETTYTLQEDDNAGFTSPTMVYNGPNTSWNATGKADGTYYYRVMASNDDGDSIWSNIEEVTVGGASGPTPGFWEGVSGDMEFYVTPDSAYVDDFAIIADLRSLGCSIYKITNTTLDTITDDEFTNGGAFYYGGTFNSEITASGYYGLDSFYIYGCGTISGGPFGWTANWENSSQPSFSIGLSAEDVQLVEDIDIPYRVFELER